MRQGFGNQGRGLVITHDLQPSAPVLTQDGLSPEAVRRLLIDVLRAGYRIRSWARAESMSPLIRKGDLLTVKPITFAEAQIGDVVAFRRDERQSVLTTHRVIQKGRDHGRAYLITKGDRSLYRDLPTVVPEQILGKVVAIEKQGRVISLETPRHRLVAYLMARRSLGLWILRVVWSKILALIQQVSPRWFPN